jgi:hypothetical protein
VRSCSARQRSFHPLTRPLRSRPPASLKGKKWQACDDPTPTYTPGAIEEVRDINGDGQPEAVITEGGTYCYGNTGSGYSLVSKQANDSWKLITKGTGILTS